MVVPHSGSQCRLFILYINDIDACVESNISKFADDTKLFIDVGTLASQRKLQKDLNNLVDWAKIGN